MLLSEQTKANYQNELMRMGNIRIKKAAAAPVLEWLGDNYKIDNEYRIESVDYVSISKRIRIRLTKDLPIEALHGATAGRVFDVTRVEERTRWEQSLAYFVGDAGEECAALDTECEIVTF